jgi:hypothetical protein
MVASSTIQFWIETCSANATLVGVSLRFHVDSMSNGFIVYLHCHIF